MCQYTAEAGDRYLAWFALEGHADPVMITRLCASLGTCARHTRRLIGQPGAAARLTAVYRYLLQAALEPLAGRGRWRPAGCPACQHDEAADGRALGTLLDGLPETAVRERYLELGGMCWPHVRAAASVRGHRRAAAWAARAAAASAAGQPAGLGVLAGEPDHDAGERARLRAALPAALPAGGRPPPGACLACFASARAEAGALTGLAQAAGRGPLAGDAGAAGPRHEGGLCAGHLRDAALLPGGQGAAVLGWQAGSQAAILARLASSPARRRGDAAGWLRGRPAPAPGDECPVCRARERAARQALRHWAAQRAAPAARRGASPPARGDAQLLCVRHVLALRAAGPDAGQLAAAHAARRAAALIEELAEAFRKNTWAFRHESRGAETTAWRRAAAFLDGAVFGGGPPE
ncbi:MAG TPA: hypothetical protein VGF54_10310 [Streptosporangiaceae bacterium]